MLLIPSFESSFLKSFISSMFSPIITEGFEGSNFLIVSSMTLLSTIVGMYLIFLVCLFLICERTLPISTLNSSFFSFSPTSVIEK